jgi:hypothetical protein
MTRCREPEALDGSLSTSKAGPDLASAKVRRVFVIVALKALLQTRRVQAGAAMIALTSFLSAATLNQTLKRVVFSLPEGAEPIDASPVVAGDDAPMAEGGAPENAEPRP